MLVFRYINAEYEYGLKCLIYRFEFIYLNFTIISIFVDENMF